MRKVETYLKRRNNLGLSAQSLSRNFRRVSERIRREISEQLYVFSETVSDRCNFVVKRQMNVNIYRYALLDLKRQCGILIKKYGSWT